MDLSLRWCGFHRVISQVPRWRWRTWILFGTRPLICQLQSQSMPVWRHHHLTICCKMWWIVMFFLVGDNMFMASWVLFWERFWCFNSSTVYINLLFHSLDAEHSPPTANATKTERLRLTSQSVAGCVRSSFLEAIVGSPKADASKIDPWLKGPAENLGQQKGHRVHSSTFGACLMFALSWGETRMACVWGGDSTSCPVHLGVSKGWHCLGWKQTTHRHIALAFFWSTCLRMTSYHMWHDITWLWQKHWIFLGELLYELWILAMWYPLYIPLVLPWQAEAEGLEQWKELMHLICSLESSLVSLEKIVQFIYPSVFLNRPGNRYSLWMFTDIILYNSYIFIPNPRR